MSDLADLDLFLDLPRIGGAALAPDSSRLVVVVSVPGPKRTNFVSSLWEVSTDPDGPPARRLTWGPGNAFDPVFRPDGSVVFTSTRPDPDGDQDDCLPSLWLLPATGGEARPFVTRAWGISSVRVAEQAGTVVVAAAALPTSTGPGDDERRHRARRDLKVGATLHESVPFRWWDEFWGPAADRLFALEEDPEDGLPKLRDLTGHVGPALRPTPFHLLTPDGSTVICDWQVIDPGARIRSTVVAVEVATGARRTLLDDPRAQLSGPSLSPDGTMLAYLATSLPTPDEPGRTRLMLLHLTGDRAGQIEDPAPGWDREPAAVAVWTPDGRALLVVADDEGHAPVFRIELPEPTETGPTETGPTETGPTETGPTETGPTETGPTETGPTETGPDETGATETGATETGATETGPDDCELDRSGVDGSTAAAHTGAARADAARSVAVRRLTAAGAFSHLAVTRSGAALFALRSGVDTPPTPVRIDPVTGEVTALRGPAPALELPGTLTEVHAVAADGTPLRAWLVLPEDAHGSAPAPLLLWIHGGPMASWNAWSWRWNPWPAAARGYAVLLPDPALSTGYGADFVRRGWAGWGGTPYTDLMAITDVVAAREDIDADRSAAMGGSFGGYMANWIAGHTDRFRGIVSHAGIWDLEVFGQTTDATSYWRDTATAAMLIVHGEKDYRVPVGEAIAQFNRLGELFVDRDGTMPHRLLVFDDENHWVLKPQNARLWYETVFAFLARTVHGAPWQPPELLQ